MAVVRQALNVAYGGIALQLIDVREPVAAVASLDERSQLFEHFARVADQSGIHVNVLIDFRAIDFDVNLARVPARRFADRL